jgi:hypothetical protein
MPRLKPAVDAMPVTWLDEAVSVPLTDLVLKLALARSPS